VSAAAPTAPAEVLPVLRPARRRLAAALAAVAATDTTVGIWRARIAEGMRIRVRADRRRATVVYERRNWDRPQDRWEQACRHESAAEAWEALAAREVIPHDWVGDPRRGFDAGTVLHSWPTTVDAPADAGWHLEYSSGATRLVTRAEIGALARARLQSYDAAAREVLRGGWTMPLPPTVAACVALASDPEGVLAAEGLAHQVVHHLEATRFRRADSITWRVGGAAPAPFRGGGEIDVAAAAIESLGYAIAAVDAATVTLFCPDLEGP
jgi:hypothetical protein